MKNLFQSALIKVIRRFNLQKEVLSELLYEKNIHKVEQEKQELIFQYLKGVIKENKLNKAYFLDALVKISEDNKIRLDVPELMAISNDYVGMRILTEGYFEKDLLDFLSKYIFCRKDISDGIALDVGAFIGTHTMYMARYFKHVAAFEPNPFVFKVLEANINSAGLTNVYPLNFGLARVEEAIGYYKYDGGNQAMNRFIKDGEKINPDEKLIKIGDLVLKSGSASVSELMLKHDLTAKVITLIKIDTEGFESEVLMGLAEILATQSAIVLFEASGLRKATEIINLLKGFGYTYFAELQEYLPITPVPVVIQDKFYPLILASKTVMDFNIPSDNSTA